MSNAGCLISGSKELFLGSLLLGSVETTPDGDRLTFTAIISGEDGKVVKYGASSYEDAFQILKDPSLNPAFAFALKMELDRIVEHPEDLLR